MIAIGVVVVLIGVAAYFGGLSWFGNLPGDIKIERENMSVYIPIVSMLLISLVFSLISYILRRFF